VTWAWADAAAIERARTIRGDVANLMERSSQMFSEPSDGR
jgi:hypothetical protein